MKKKEKKKRTGINNNVSRSRFWGTKCYLVGYFEKLWETLKPKNGKNKQTLKKQSNKKVVKNENKVDATHAHIWYYISDDLYTSEYNII